LPRAYGNARYTAELSRPDIIAAIIDGRHRRKLAFGFVYVQIERINVAPNYQEPPVATPTSNSFGACARRLRVRHACDGQSKPVGTFSKSCFQARHCPGPFSAQRNGKWFVILENGAVLGGNSGFDNLNGTSGSHIAVQVAGKWGIIDRSRRFSVPPRFTSLRPDRDGTFAVKTGDGAYWINGSGARVSRPENRAQRSLGCPGGLRFFWRAGLWGLQNEQGKTVIAPRFRALSCFARGVSWTASPGATGWCAIGPGGEPRAKLPCHETHYPMYVTHHAPEKCSDDRYQNSVLWTRAWLDYQAGIRDKPPT
jgi:hypothetical protein